MVLYDGESYAEQIEVMWSAFIKELMGRQSDFFDFHIFWRNQVVQLDNHFDARELVFDESETNSTTPFSTVELAIKTYLLQCNEVTIEKSLLIIHDTVENGEGIIELLNDAKLIGNVVYLPYDESEAEIEVESHTEDVAQDYASNYEDNYADVGYTDNDQLYTDSNAESQSAYADYYRRRRSADGIQVIEDWQSDDKHIPLLNSICQISAQSDITQACTPETTTPLPTTTVAKTGCASYDKCSDKQLEIVFIVEVASDHSIIQVFNQLSEVISHLGQTRLSLFMNDLVLLISLPKDEFVVELEKLKVNVTDINTGSMDWARVESKAKIMLDPNGEFDLLFEDTDDYNTHSSDAYDNYDNYEDNYGDNYDNNYANNYTQSNTVTFEPVGKENLPTFASRDPVFVALPVVGGVEPESTFSDEIQLLVFEIGAKLKPYMSQHIILDTLGKIYLTFLF